jgi:arylsulfatase A-like enzyme/Flp pilus assembly protein TadD
VSRQRAAAQASLVLVFFAVAGCGRNCGRGSLAGDNVLLITLDTTRADRLGCYGYSRAATPALDALARRGTLFENALAQVPMTLPSHATLLTGRYPRELGIRLNAEAALGRDHPTLGTVFKGRGYRTAAFVAAFVLDSRYGLDRDFEVYDDDVGEGVLMRRANEVTDSTLAWLREVKEQPFFAWIHYFDPHQPYEPPEAFRGVGADLYDGEIAFVDSEVKRLMEWLETQRLADKTLVVVAGDHGESFGEHGEHGHAMFLYQTNLRVPLILAHPRLGKRGARVAEVVELADVFSTILDLFGWSTPRGLRSRSLAPALRGQALEPRESYAESHYVRHTYGWAEQRSLTSRRWKYISSTRPELYELASDPAETRDLIDEQAEVASGMRRRLLASYNAMQAGRAPEVPLDEDARGRLESLGYLSGGRSNEGEEELLTAGRPDPKDMLDVVEQLRQADQLRVRGEPERALPVLQACALRSPGSLRVRYLLAESYVAAGRPRDALRAAEATLELDRAFAPALAVAGRALVKLGRLAEGIERFRAAVALDRTQVRPLVLAAQEVQRSGDLGSAAVLYEAVLDLRPDQAAVQNELGLIRERQGRLPAAVESYRRAVQRDPELSQARFNLALALVREGKVGEAVEHLREAVRIQPAHARGFITRALAWAEEGRREEARRALEAAAQVPVTAVESSFNLGLLAIRDGQVEAAGTQLERVLSLDPAHAQALAALSRVYVKTRRFGDLARILRAAATANPSDAGIATNLALLLASCGDASVRNGAEAVEIAEHAASLSGYRRADVLATLAAAYAEAGRSEKAAGAARQALALAERAGSADLASFLRAQIAEYEAGKPYRDPRY